MKYENHKVSQIKLAYIGGGSRGWAWKFMTDLAIEPSMSGEVVLYDIDKNAAKANEIIGNKIDSMPNTVGHWKYSVADTMQEALKGADFVVISILPATFDEMAIDVHMPERLNIWQSVGDTAGAGGIIRALRTLPMFIPIAEAVRDICPNAWVINYTNPMSLCVKILYHVFPQIKAFGCCHEVFGTQKLLAAAVGEYLGTKAPNRRDIHVNVLGINHFTWFDSASYEGLDLMPIYRDFVDKYYNDGFDEPDKNWANSSFDCAHRVKFDLFRRYGYIAAAGDRHLVEFMPGDEYLENPDTVKIWKYGLTTVDWRKTDLKKRTEKSQNIINGTEQVDMEPSGEEGILLMKSLVGLDRVVSNVNIPNYGQISNLPIGSIVETNAVFYKDTIKPMLAGKMPEELVKLTMPHIENHELTLQAALSGNRDLVLKAFLNDPNIKAKCNDETEIKKLVNDMIDGTINYLPLFKN